MAVDSQGSVVATGMDQVGYMDWMTIKTDAGGNLLWSRRFDSRGGNDEIANMLVLDASDAVYVTGTGGPNPIIGNPPYLKGVVAKYGSDGTPQWTVWDPYANGKAVALGEGNTLATLGFGYLVTTHYTETGQTDVVPAAPTNLTASAALNRIDLSFVDHADNEFFVEVERCTGSGCTSFSTIGRTYGENSNGFRDTDIVAGVTYTYRVRAMGFRELPPTRIRWKPRTTPQSTTRRAELADHGHERCQRGLELAGQRDQRAPVLRRTLPGRRLHGLHRPGGEPPPTCPTWTDYNAAAGQSYSYRVHAWN